MPGNRAIYDRAMEQSREAARQQRWEESFKSAVRAVQEFPNNTDARTAVAMGLFHTEKYEKALIVLQELHQSDPNNPFFLEYIAHTYEKQGNTNAAVETHERLTKLHQQRHATSRMIGSLREILRLRPDMDQHRKQLASLLYESKYYRDAAAEYLALARRYRDRGNLDAAAENTESALQLDPNSREAKEMLSALHDAMARKAGTVPEGSEKPKAGTAYLRHGTRTLGTGGLRSQQFESDKIIDTAREYEKNKEFERAIEEYERAFEKGTTRGDAIYQLGVLYQERGRHEDAIRVLPKAALDQEYALSAHFALGDSYESLGQHSKAAEEFEKAIRLADLETIGKTESEELIKMYERAVSIYRKMGDLARSAALYSTLAQFLQSKRWGRTMAAEFHKRAKELTEENMLQKLSGFQTGTLTPPAQSMQPPPEEKEIESRTWGKIRPITDFLRSDGKIGTTGDLQEVEESPPDPLEGIEDLVPPDKPDFVPVTDLNTDGLDELTKRWVIASGRYIEQELFDAAIDACHEVIRLNINYLPIHLRMGEILERMNRVEEAQEKYEVLIDTFLVQEERQQAINVYYRAIEISNDRMTLRSHLAELLNEVGRSEEGAKQLLQVAHEQFHSGQQNRSLEQYRRALSWSPQDADLHSAYGLALYKMERYESALGEFHKALELGGDAPTNYARINITLASMREDVNMVWESLASVLEQCKDNPKVNSLIQSEYRESLSSDDDNALLHYILGIVQQYSAQHTSAIFEFEQAELILETEGDDILSPVLVKQAMADSYIALEQADQALEKLQEGAQESGQAAKNGKQKNKHPFARPLSQGELVRRMAEAYAAKGDLEGAEQALVQAQKHLPYDRSVYTKLSDIYFQQGKLSEAVAQLDELATHYENRQYLDSAIEILQDGLKLAPNNVNIGSRLANLYIRRGYPDKGIEGLVKVADQQRRTGQLKDAIASLQKAAEILWMQGKQDEVLAIYDKIIQIAPNDLEARQWIAIMHTLANRNKEAITQKKEIVRILAEQRDYDNAIAELHQIIGLNQQDIEAHFLLGDMLMRRGEYTQAVKLYARMSKMENIDVDRVEALQAAANRMLQQQQQQHE
jgi:tetratricopeptide (TPR) repeat protein